MRLSEPNSEMQKVLVGRDGRFSELVHTNNPLHQQNTNPILLFRTKLAVVGKAINPDTEDKGGGRKLIQS